jgi:hypothetical protein
MKLDDARKDALRAREGYYMERIERLEAMVLDLKKRVSLLEPILKRKGGVEDVEMAN